MSAGSDDLMTRVLHGRKAERHQWDDYYRKFHARVPSATPETYRFLRTVDGKTSYELLISALPLSACNVLDVGCGDGFLLEAVQERLHRATLFGIDLSADELEIARGRLARARVGALVEGSALKLPFESRSFDLVFSHMVLMLIPEVESVLREIHRVLKIGGTVAFVVGDPHSTNDRMNVLFDRINDVVRKSYPDFAPLNPADPRIFSAGGVSRMLTEVGFKESHQTQFVSGAELSEAELFEQLKRRYYVGSFSNDVLRSIKDLVQTVAGDGFCYTEALRLVVARR